MNHAIYHRLFIIAIATVAICAAMVSPTAVYADEAIQEKKLIVGPDNEIYGTQEAADLVSEAHKFDPMYCPREQADRDMAASLYEKAIAAQPGAKLNAPLADRIAQLYAFNEDKEKKVSPNRSTAAQWWNQCIDSTNSNQLLWAQAQMGLASMAVGGGDYISALEQYKKILDMDMSRVELPDWKYWPDGNTERGKITLEQEQARLQEAIKDIQARAREKKTYTLNHISEDASRVSLHGGSFWSKGAHLGDPASTITAAIDSQAGKNPLVPSANIVDKHDPQSPVQEDKTLGSVYWIRIRRYFSIIPSFTKARKFSPSFS